MTIFPFQRESNKSFKELKSVFFTIERLTKSTLETVASDMRNVEGGFLSANPIPGFMVSPLVVPTWLCYGTKASNSLQNSFQSFEHGTTSSVAMI